MPLAQTPSPEPQVAFAGTPASGGNQTLSGSATTVALPLTGCEVILTPSSGFGSGIMPKGQFDGQLVYVINNSANPMTMAASGSSNVANGTSAVISANTASLFVWNQGAGLWFKIVT